MKDSGLLVPGKVVEQMRRGGNKERVAGPWGRETRPWGREEVWTEMAGVPVL